MTVSAATAVFVGSLMVVVYGAVMAIFSIVGMTIPPPPWRGDYHLCAGTE